MAKAPQRFRFTEPVAELAVLHSAITWALDNKLILSDPLDGMHAPSRPHPRLHPRPGEVRQLILTTDAAVERTRALLADHPDRRHLQLAVFRAEQDALLVRLAADSGAGRGELNAGTSRLCQRRVVVSSRSHNVAGSPARRRDL